MFIEVYYNFKKKENEVIPMENKLVLLSLRDRENPDVEKMFVQLKENNSVLYRFLISTLQKDPLLGVRQDVFTYIAANATEFNQNQRYMFNLSRIMCNIKISPEHIKWIDSYLRKKGEYETVDDFFIIFDEAVEKDMSLEQIQSFFETESDEVILYDKIMNYESETNDTVAETTQLETESESQVEPEHEIEIEKKENYQSKNSNVTEMFQNLINVMSRKEETDDEVRSVDENFKQIVAKLQLITSELMAYSTEVVHALEFKDQENERLTSLMKIQQHVMASQQEKINELHIQIAHLNRRIQNSEKTEMQRAAINQKIFELQNLTMNERKEEEYPLVFNDDIRG